MFVFNYVLKCVHSMGMGVLGLETSQSMCMGVLGVRLFVWCVFLSVVFFS